MDEKTKVALIRKGNEAMNSGDINTATKIFRATNYKSGLIRLGDFWMDQHKPLVAYGYYKQAEHKSRLDQLHEGFLFALKCWLKEDKAANKVEAGKLVQSPVKNVQSSSLSKATDKKINVILELDESLLE